MMKVWAWTCCLLTPCGSVLHTLHHIPEEHHHHGEGRHPDGDIHIPKSMEGDGMDREWTWTYDNVSDWVNYARDCGGRSQSPIDIRGENVTGNISHFDTLRVNYRSKRNVKVHNNGHTFKLNGDFGSITLPDGIHEVKHISFHMPSEHTIDGVGAAGEMQIMHQRLDKHGAWHMAAVAILMHDFNHLENYTKYTQMQNLSNYTNYTHQETHHFLKFLHKVGFGGKLPKKDGKHVTVKRINLGWLDPIVHGGYWHYYGSQTAPPCSETVHWYVMMRPMPVTYFMIEHFTKVLGFKNNRPTQPLYDRSVRINEHNVHNEFPNEGKWDNR